MPVRDSLKAALTRSPHVYTAARRAYSMGRFPARGVHEADYRAFALFEGEGPFLAAGADAEISVLSFRVRQPILFRPAPAR